ncbi:MAG TPA: efflux RND transporter periplasmic adaptor subunit [Kofleriaceae bacterium]|nr:efflux RND transporter periplasmic adaptor subunit [Kofleriaceae bacterium]
MIVPAAAVAVSIAAVLLAMKYRRPDPPPETPAPGMNVGSDTVALTGDAPQWSSIKIGKAVAAQPRWSDPSPARVVIDETKTSRIGSPLEGRVTAVNVQRGGSVKAGQILFVVSSPNLADLRADRDKAVVEQATAKANLDRTQALVDANAMPAKELLAAQQQYAEAQLAVRTADSKLASLRVQGARDGGFSVTAPRDGVVVERNVDLGQTVTAEAGGLIVIADLSDVWVVVDLFEEDVGRLAVGAKAKVTLRSLPGVEFEGTVDQVSAVVDPDRHTVPVRVRLDNPNGQLRPHSYAQVQFFEPSPAQVEVPASAVMSDGDKSYVYIATPSGKGTTFARRDVVAGALHEGTVPIYSGLAVGDSVVVQGAVLLDNQISISN